MKTIYFNDIGLRNFALNQFGNESSFEHSGHLFQCFVFAILQEILRNRFYTIHYWRTTDLAEVDFVIRSGNRIIPMEVKFSKLKTDRISRSFRNFINSYNPEKAYIINLDYSNKIVLNNTVVNFIPYYQLYEGFLD